MDRNLFHQAIEHFYNDTQSCPSEVKWTLVSQSRYKYLTRCTFHRMENSNVSDQTQGDELLQVSDPATANVERVHMIKLEHHIVYSPGYQVPVLYFNGYDAEGTALSLDDLYRWVVSKEMQDSLKHSNTLSAQGSISQEEHPVLGLPFYYIHPCETQSMMRSIAGSHGEINISNYIKTWLSFIGPAAQCTLSHQLFLQ
ncbi:autophagocytosis associated protein [Fennellomyces sp. T-0311]|nr:autophagocytosis associated protein [Fennellomyces sp. T-0311]